jgi:hypothetical protein
VTALSEGCPPQPGVTVEASLLAHNRLYVSIAYHPRYRHTERPPQDHSLVNTLPWCDLLSFGRLERRGTYGFRSCDRVGSKPGFPPRVQAPPYGHKVPSDEATGCAKTPAEPERLVSREVQNPVEEAVVTMRHPRRRLPAHPNASARLFHPIVSSPTR